LAEEEAFRQTLRTGTTLFDTAVAELQASGVKELPGDRAFILHDTYGFPIDVTLEMAAEAGLSVDEVGFRRLMEEQRQRAKADARERKSGVGSQTTYREIIDAGGATMFTGYVEAQSEATVIGLVRDGESVPVASLGEHVEVLMNRSPFYAEAGGQLGDHGVIEGPNGSALRVYDVQTPLAGVFIHRAEVIYGEIAVGDVVMASVDVQRRRAISRAHTATHMIHRAFRERLGDTATQMGSENAPGRLRFDFPSAGPVAPDVLAEVEARVNDVLIEDLEVEANVMTQSEARAMGAMALFGEKYGDQVRVVSVGDWAHELCGGTHAQRSGQLGVVSFLSEGSIGAGVRRVEALVGADAYAFLAREHILVNRLTQLVKVPGDQLVERIEHLVSSLRDAERDLQKLRTAQLTSDLGGLMGEPITVKDVRVWAFAAPEGTSGGDLRDIVAKARTRVGNDGAVVVIATANDDGKVAMMAAVNEAAQGLGLSANTILAAGLPAIDGRGGGKADVAQGGGTKMAGAADARAGAIDKVRNDLGA
jgi:alanyl-tRNA synthetase